MNRRSFLASLPAAFLLGRAMAVRSGSQPAVPAQIGISSWSFHTYFPKTRWNTPVPPGGDMDLLDFPEMVADRYGVHAIEIVAPHFAETTPGYLAELRRRLQRAHVRLVNIPADIDGLWDQPGLSDPDERKREAALKSYLPWVDVAKAMGAASIRCDPGKIRPDHLDVTVDSYRRLADYGRSRGVRILIENHGGVGSEHPEQLTRIFRAIPGHEVAALPDFGNFPDNATRWRGLQALLPDAATVCHAKDRSHENGKKVMVDLARCVGMARQAGFQGVYSIEYEGSLDPHVGVARVIGELRKALA